MNKIRHVLMVVLILLIIVPYLQISHIKYNIKTKHKHVQNDWNRNWRNLTQDEMKSLSKLGRILFLEEPTPRLEKRQAPYTILVWKYGAVLERRHIMRYTAKRFNPFESCSVSNCKITYKESDLAVADLVLFHLQRISSVHELPLDQRLTSQIWTFLSDESPYHIFRERNSNSLTHYNGVFNWSMTYRMHSDIPVPYGRTILKHSTSVNWDLKAWENSKDQTVLVAIMVSNCNAHNGRWQYVEELRKHIKIDIYGSCGNLRYVGGIPRLLLWSNYRCPGHFNVDCPKISKYKFYLSFENSNCDEYITEKVWWNALHKNSIPIVMGGSKESYKKILPPNSFIHVNDFLRPRDLANYITYLNDSQSELHNYFKWKKNFTILNEHGYFQSVSVHYCRMCEALNYNSKETRIYTNLETFLSKKRCQPS